MKVIFLKRDPSFFGWLIKLWTGGPYSHCEILFSDGMMASSMQGEGVRFTHVGQQNFAIDWDSIEVPANEAEEQLVRKWFYGELGAGYDWYGLFCCQVLGYHREDPHDWWCSEACTAAIQTIGFLKKIQPYTLSPNGMYKKLRKELGLV